MSPTLTLYAISNEVDTDTASDAYDAIVRGLSGGPVAILDELARVGILPDDTSREELSETKRELEEAEAKEAAARDERDTVQEQHDETKREIDDLNTRIAELEKCNGYLADQVKRWKSGEPAPEPVPTVWVKTTSHRARDLLRRAFDRAGLEDEDIPQPWFRRASARSKSFVRQEGEFWEIPVTVDLSRIKGATVLKRPVPVSDRFRPGFSS